MFEEIVVSVSRNFFPIKLFEWFSSLEFVCQTSRLNSIVSKILANRDITLNNGVGIGVKFNSSNYNLQTAMGMYELPLQKALSKYLKEGDVVYDIGANVGFFTIISAKLVGDSGSVYAFEPDPDNIKNLEHNIQLNSFAQVTVLERAVSRSTKTGELLLAGHSGSRTLSTTAKSKSQKYQSCPKIPVQLVAIDDLVAQQIIAPPAVVKIDVEGSELDVLQGMSQTIKKFKPIILYEIDDPVKETFLQKQEEADAFVQQFAYQIIPLADWYPQINHHVGHVVAIPQGQS